MKTSIVECIATGQHLKSCDDDGYCNNCGYQDDPLWSGRLLDPKDDLSQTADEWLKKNGGWIDEVAEANDNLGTCQGVAFTMLCLLAPPGFQRKFETNDAEWVHAVQLVFEHGIVDARRDTFELLSIRTLTRFDGS